MQEVGMANWMIIRFAALATFSMALVAAPSFTPAFAAGGGGGGIGVFLLPQADAKTIDASARHSSARFE